MLLDNAALIAGFWTRPEQQAWGNRLSRINYKPPHPPHSAQTACQPAWSSATLPFKCHLPSNPAWWPHAMPSPSSLTQNQPQASQHAPSRLLAQLPQLCPPAGTPDCSALHSSQAPARVPRKRKLPPPGPSPTCWAVLPAQRCPVQLSLQLCPVQLSQQTIQPPGRSEGMLPSLAAAPQAAKGVGVTEQLSRPQPQSRQSLGFVGEHQGPASRPGQLGPPLQRVWLGALR